MELGANVYHYRKTGEHLQAYHKGIAGNGLQRTFLFGDGSRGIAAHAPYDKIIVTAGAPLCLRYC